MARLQAAGVRGSSHGPALISSPRQIANSYCTPAQFSHKLRQASKGAGRPIALWEFKQVQERLTANALQPLVVDVAAHALKRELLRIDGLGGRELCFFSLQSLKERRQDLAHNCAVETLGQSRVRLA